MSIGLREVVNYALTTTTPSGNTSSVRDVEVYVAVAATNQSSIRDVEVYVAVNMPAVMSIRDATAYTLSDDLRGLKVRDVSSYVLSDVNGKPLFNLAGKASLLRAINREYKTNFTAAHLDFAAPQVRANDPEFNSTVAITATNVATYRGSFTFVYSRFDLSVAFGAQVLDVPAGMGNSIWNSLAVINAKFGLALDTTDVLDAPVAPGQQTVVLTVAPTSLLYIPGRQLQLGTIPTLASITPVTNLDGFRWDTLTEAFPITNLAGFDAEG